MRKIICFIFIIFLIFAGIQVETVFGKAEDLKILSSSNNQLVIEFTPQNWQKEQVQNNQAYTRYSFDYAVSDGEPGEPYLPGRVFYVGIPPSGDISFEIMDSEFETERDINLIPVPHLQSDEFAYQEFYNTNSDLYKEQQYLPQNIVGNDPPALFRQQRIARFTFHPLQYLPQQKLIRKYRRIQVRISFSNPQSVSTARGVAVERDNVTKSLLLNSEQSREWRVPKVVPLRKSTTINFEGNNWYKIVIQGDGFGGKEGIYKLDGETLSKAGVPTAGINPGTIQLFHNGGKELPLDIQALRPDSLIEIPIEVSGISDGRFDSGDYFVFYGQSLEGTSFESASKEYRHYIHKYSYDNVYWLTFGANNTKKLEGKQALSTQGVTVEPSFRDLAFLEEEKRNVYGSGRIWFGAQLSSESQSASYNFQLPGAVSQDTAFFRIQTAVETQGSHYFTLSVNGNRIGQFTKSGGYDSYRLQRTDLAGQGVLLDGENSVDISYVPSSDIAFSSIDWLEIEYNRTFEAENDQLIFHSPLRNGVAHYRITGFSRDDIVVYDITDVSNSTKISNFSVNNGTISFADETSSSQPRRYIAFTASAFKNVSSVEQVDIAGLRRARNTDYIIITHDDFYQQALQLKSLREDYNDSDRLATEVVNMSSIINEFGWGIPDPTAIRDFLAYTQENWGDPRYVLLLGDGHYDYKDILKFGTPNLIPPYQTEDSNVNVTRTTDDWFTYTRGSTYGMQMAIGRLPVQTVDEAQNMIDKIVTYETKQDYGEWRKILTIVGDDELVVGGTGNETIHTRDAERLAEQHVPDLLNVDKIYLTEYSAVQTASVSGITKPTATEALLERINRGTLVLNFIGHGNDELWAHERVLNGSTDFERIQNGDRMAMWVAATCSFAHWDQPQKQSLAERILTMRANGAVSMVSSARVAYASENAAFNRALYDELFEDYEETGVTQRVGDAVMVAKMFGGGRTNSEKYGVFGDPAMRLGAPRYHAVIDKIEPDSIQALRKAAIQGHIERGGQPWTDFNGKVLLRVLDSRKNRTYETASGSTISYMLEGNSIFRGVATVRNGYFEVEFIVPKDISYGGTDGRISLYFWNDSYDGSGIREKLVVGGTAVDLVDQEGPNILLHFGNADFNPGDYTTTDPVLHLEVSDSLSGVNIAGDIGHQITLTLDDDVANAKDVTEFFEYDEGSYLKGSLDYKLQGLSEGPHNMLVKAWDNSNNSSTLETNFIAVTDSVLRIRDLLTYPNPMVDQTAFSYEVSQESEITLKIYSLSGRVLRKFETTISDLGFNVFPEVWDGRDQDGDMLANGVYLYKLTAKSINTTDDVKAEKIGKLIIAR